MRTALNKQNNVQIYPALISLLNCNMSLDFNPESIITNELNVFLSFVKHSIIPSNKYRTVRFCRYTKLRAREIYNEVKSSSINGALKNNILFCLSKVLDGPDRFYHIYYYCSRLDKNLNS